MEVDPLASSALIGDIGLYGALGTDVSVRCRCAYGAVVPHGAGIPSCCIACVEGELVAVEEGGYGVAHVGAVGIDAVVGGAGRRR